MCHDARAVARTVCAIQFDHPMFSEGMTAQAPLEKLDASALAAR